MEKEVTKSQSLKQSKIVPHLKKTNYSSVNSFKVSKLLEKMKKVSIYSERKRKGHRPDVRLLFHIMVGLTAPR
jgi:hypothetical protein